MAITRRFELVANVCVAAVAAAILYVVVSSSTAKSLPEPFARPGASLELAGVDWRENRRTLVLFIQEHCEDCEKSAPFHKRAIEEARKEAAKILAVLPVRSTDAVRYADELGVKPADVVAADVPSLGVHKLPSIAIIGGSGKIQRIWVGKLNERQEKDVFKTLRSPSM